MSADDTDAAYRAVRVVVQPPLPTGGRRVRADGEILGLAHNTADVAEFLRRAGLEIDSAEVARAPWIDWRGAGPDRWSG
ncbi:hypothetical protein SZN_26059 [Streptomyces zinciresistens K42]|uniref:Uncharacterized protein n=1 Tax=Streptomyces zinciresistens K42 TaxID=700597 RepID=G2GI72_9ACTN|nr:hypothetical protein [Streptomyces zinciresistens]EGX56804.1 hypothetical protein SZN_26059 [Streptomyces zinciresistens K42]